MNSYSSASSKGASSHKFDFAVIGGGILGVTISYWISSLYDSTVVLIDKENEVATHTSGRNTGMVHRPFYLNPDKKKLFATVAQKSYPMWKEIALKYNLPWNPVGTLEVATSDEQVRTLEQYKIWAADNGMDDDEIDILDGIGVQKLEPEVKCAGAIHSKTDTCVSYSDFTNFIFQNALKNGVKFMGGCKVIGGIGDRIMIRLNDGNIKEISVGFIINAAGGGSVELAHKFGIGNEYASLFFRGEYWKVEPPFASKVSRNVYSVPRHKEFPFLDPHFIARANGTREIGPNAVLVLDPGAYTGLTAKKSQVISRIFERPMIPKIKLFTSKTFLSLIWHEWQSSISKAAMCERVQRFLPALDPKFLKERGLAGVRASVIDNDGFVPEALPLKGNNSLHILNYNSPGATGAPAFSAYLVSKLTEEGRFDGMKESETSSKFWKFEDMSDL
ncbi:MAG: FAD-dependent oxidoreductase [Nitrososphaerota archaeon]|nr:FAD-dependent oxidoreductase [Nitrososphaerota archaeon]